ncbi:MAG TPA: hypothetical protein PKE12_13185 [Kiritimatiellia bacterium]|nr:hypothetical protein [Kiritimatiellia bacterium]
MRFLFLLMFVLAARPAPAQAVAPPEFQEQFARLAGLVDSEEPGALDLARGSMDAARFVAAGATTVPWVERRFASAASFGEASVAGLYLTVWGKANQLDAIRRELETNATKRKWLAGLVGTESLFMEHLESGATYQPMLRLLPSAGGARSLALKCIDSKDPLVRRAGLFWGYWLADDAYWKAVRALAKKEPDRATLRIAQQVLLKSVK